MSIRLIALDLDGTLLNSKKELTERNRKALETERLLKPALRRESGLFPAQAGLPWVFQTSSEEFRVSVMRLQ